MNFVVSSILSLNLFGQSNNEVSEIIEMCLEPDVFLHNRWSEKISVTHPETALTQNKLPHLDNKYSGSLSPFQKASFQQDGVTWRISRFSEDIEVYIDNQKVGEDSLKIGPGPHEIIVFHLPSGLMVKKQIVIDQATEKQMQIRAIFTPYLPRDALRHSVLLPWLMPSFVQRGLFPKARRYFYKFGSVLSMGHQLWRLYEYSGKLSKFEASNKEYTEFTPGLRDKLPEDEFFSSKIKMTTDHFLLARSAEWNRNAAAITSLIYLLNVVDLMFSGSANLDVEILPASHTLMKLSPAFSYAGETIQFGIKLTF